ncbi:MAG: rhomboid family intramembrane serine protease [Gemmatimonadota bacterium]|nr:MAG: rhomboid family intramembrane serine protease [Gemmatimonadota bacterium]
MFPLYDDNPTEMFPIVTLALIGLSVGVWVFLQGGGLTPELLDGSICSLGAIPAELTGRLGEGAIRITGDGPCILGGLRWGALVTSVFLHGSWVHLIGNMWFLWIFGNNVEDAMGHFRFAVFYVLTGVIAALGHVVVSPTSTMPLVGASGAISAIMGAYLVLYPRARVATLFVFIIVFRIIPLPAFVMLGMWFAYQLLASLLMPAGVGGGVAFAAHIAGFLAGLGLIFLFRDSRLVAAKRGQAALAAGP